MKHKIEIYEHPPGAGKTFAFMNHMSKSTNKFVYAVPTLVMVGQVMNDLRQKYPHLSVKELTSATQDDTVTQWLALNSYLLGDYQIIVTTHATVLNNYQHFIGYELIIDELPKEVLSFRSMWTSHADAEQLKMILKSEELIKERIQDYNNGSVELSEEKVNFLRSVSALGLDPIIRVYEDKQSFHYVKFAPYETFDVFEKIHLLGATVKTTLPYIYFTQLCGYKPIDGTVSIRGNKMDNQVTIYPLVMLEGERDFISREILESEYNGSTVVDSMIEIVKSHSKSKCITVTNASKQAAIDGNKPLELIPTHAHGLNAYKEQTEAAIIFTANPNPFDIPFMKHFSKAIGCREDLLVDAYIE